MFANNSYVIVSSVFEQADGRIVDDETDDSD
jgi:hypothetical protein